MPKLTVVPALLAAFAFAGFAPGGQVAGAQRELRASGNANNMNNAVMGRITDASGNPVAGTMVTLLRKTVSRVDGASRMSGDALLGSNANDRGEFRFDHLSPGSYYPVAFPQNLKVGTTTRATRTGYAITYYPGVVSSTDAKAVDVGPSSTVAADIILVSSPLWVISGSIVGPLGEPWHGDRLGVTHADGLFGWDPKQVSIAANGTFVVPNMPKGSYCLDMHEGAWPPPRDTIPTGIFGAQVTVVDRDVANIRVVPIHMVTASGRVVIDPADRAAFQPSSIRIGAAPASSDCNPGPQRPGTIRDDLTFEFHTWPGRGVAYLTRSTLNDVPTTIRLNGVDVTKTGIDFKEGREIRGLEVTIAKGASARAKSPVSPSR